MGQESYYTIPTPGYTTIGEGKQREKSWGGKEKRIKRGGDRFSFLSQIPR